MARQESSGTTQGILQVYPQCDSQATERISIIVDECKECFQKGVCPSNCCMERPSENQVIMCQAPATVGGVGCCIRVMGDDVIDIATEELAAISGIDENGKCQAANPAMVTSACTKSTCAVGGSAGVLQQCEGGVIVPNPRVPFVSPAICANDDGTVPASALTKFKAPDGDQTPTETATTAPPATTAAGTQAPAVDESTTASTTVPPNTVTEPVTVPPVETVDETESDNPDAETLVDDESDSEVGSAFGDTGSSTSTDGNGTNTSTASSTRACFPVTSTVELENGAIVSMADLKVGDRVRVSPTEFSEVFMFTHKLRFERSDFVRIHTSRGHVLTASPGHYLHVSNGLALAGSVHAGDSLFLADGSTVTVLGVSTVVGVGLYNPQTLHGDIVVDGLIATCYTSAIQPDLAHAVLAPLRVLYAMIGYSSAVLDAGMPFQGLQPVLRAAWLRASSTSVSRIQ